MRNFLLVLLVLMFSSVSFAHGTDSPPVQPVLTTPAISSGQDNHNNRDDNVKHGVEFIIVGGLIYCTYTRQCWKPDAFTFTGKQKPPE